jgi:hypothetical protein
MIIIKNKIMATDLDGIFNFGLKGIRDRKIFDKWLEELKALNLNRATDHNGIEEEGEWDYYITGFGGDDPLENDDPDMPYEVVYEGPYMMKIFLMDDISQIPTFSRLSILFEQPEWFLEFIDKIHSIIRIFGSNQLIWLSSLGSASYSSIYQSKVWINTPYEKVRELLIEQYGNPKTKYEEMAEYDRTNFEYKNIDIFIEDTF